MIHMILLLIILKIVTFEGIIISFVICDIIRYIYNTCMLIDDSKWSYPHTYISNEAYL